MDPVTIYNIVKIIWSFIRKYWPHMTIGVLILVIGGIMIYYKLVISSLNDDINKLKLEKENLTQQIDTLNQTLEKEKKGFNDMVKEYDKCINDKKNLNQSYTDLVQILKNKNSYTISISDAVAKEREKLTVLKSECKKDGKDAILQVTYECPKYTEIIKIRNKMINEFNNGTDGEK